MKRCLQKETIMQVHIVEEQKLHKDQDHITKNISWTEHIITETFKKKKKKKGCNT